MESSRISARLTVKSRTIDPVLVWSVVIGCGLGIIGLWWGWFDDWHPDSVALNSLRSPGFVPLEPVSFTTPPFHTYLNFFLSLLPLKLLERLVEAVSKSNLDFYPAVLWWSRLIQVALFLGTIVCTYAIVVRANGMSAARSAALIMATCAGFVMHAHFLTADIPVMFWMLASFLVAQSIMFTRSQRKYVLAGLLAGVSAATRYNGLMVALAIPVFHYFSNRTASLRRIATDGRLWLAALMVVAGFVAANPYSVIHVTRFTNDLTYEYMTTQALEGTREGTGYTWFASRVVHVLGWPLTVVAIVAAVAAMPCAARASDKQRATTGAALGIFLACFATFGSAPFVPVRYAVPVVPFLLIGGSLVVPFIDNAGKRLRQIAAGGMGLMLAYNVVASLSVDYRLAKDPRMSAESWVASNVKANSNVESSPYSPEWNHYPGVRVKDVRMPMASGRSRMLSQLFKDDTDIGNALQSREPDTTALWYRATSLRSRRPDFITLDSQYYMRFFDPPVGPLYPDVAEYMRKLMNGELGYTVVFDESSPRPPAWLYPDDVDYVDNRLLILKRSDSPTVYQKAGQLSRSPVSQD